MDFEQTRGDGGQWHTPSQEKHSRSRSAVIRRRPKTDYGQPTAPAKIRAEARFTVSDPPFSRHVIGTCQRCQAKLNALALSAEPLTQAMRGRARAACSRQIQADCHTVARRRLSEARRHTRPPTASRFLRGCCRRHELAGRGSWPKLFRRPSKTRHFCGTERRPVPARQGAVEWPRCAPAKTPISHSLRSGRLCLRDASWSIHGRIVVGPASVR